MSTPGKSAKKIFAQKREKKPIEDPRFKQIESDPRFKRFHADKAKLKVDSRFKSMFTDKKFQVSSKYDPRGKRVDKSQQEDYKKFYELEEDEEQDNEENQEEPEEEIQERQERQEARPKRRGPHFNQAIYEGFSSSSSEDESDLSDDQAEIEDDEYFNEDKNDDDQVEMGEATKRIAVMNCDWWKLKAVDLFVVFSSFLPTGGSIKSVTIYPSDFGEQELAKETVSGPKVFEEVEEEEGERTEDGKFIDPEKEARRLTKIRQYEVNRFKYYYAVVELDSIKTASLVYEQCDGLEIERTSNVLDLRYIPDDVKFTKTPKDVATSAPYDYKAPTFFTAALQSSNVEITWDQTDYNRLQLTTKKFNKEEMKEDDFRAYLASDSEESEEDLPPLEGEENDEDREKIRNKYQSLIEAITPKFQEEEEMEITFTPGFSEKAEDLLEEKRERDKEKDETVWETQQRKMREKKKEKKAARKEEFKRQEEEQKAELAKLKKRKGKKGKETEEEKKAKAELELLMMEEGGKEYKKGYNLQSLIEDDEDGKKSKRKRKMEKKKEDEFKVDVQDERFQQLFSNPQDFGIDPTHKNYKKTAGMKQIMKERVSRRQTSEEVAQREASQPNSEISNLINSVKKKAQMHPVVKKQKF